MKKSTNEWIHSAESDLQLIGMILSQENLTHLTAFHAQQSIEKAFDIRVNWDYFLMVNQPSLKQHCFTHWRNICMKKQRNVY